MMRFMITLLLLLLASPAAAQLQMDFAFGVGFEQGGEGGFRNDFDTRVVLGLKIGDAGSAEINFEWYFLEDDRPVSALLLVRWGSNQSTRRTESS